VYESKVMNGVNFYEFAPDKTITVRDSMVAIVRILGFESLAQSAGGYPGGYIYAATKLKAFNHITASQDAVLTYGDLWELMDWALEAPTADSSYYMSNGVLTEEITLGKNNPSLMEKYLGLNMYEAIINSINTEDYTIDVTITDADDDSKYQIGDTEIFKASLGVNIIAFDKTKVNLWVTDEGELMYLMLADDCEVIYGTVASVNLDYDLTSRYHTNNIEMLTLLDDEEEYEVSEGGMTFYSDEKISSGYVTLNGSYIRMVLYEDEIISVETWDFKEGGIVEALTAKELSLTKGRTTESMRNFDSFTKVVYILEGESRDIKDMKPGTLIDYWVSSDKSTIVILGSERVHTDIFESTIGTTEIEIGNVILEKGKTIYSSIDGEKYRDTDYTELLGHKVNALIDAYGKVRYISAAQDVNDGSFAGYLLDIFEASGLDSKVTVRVVNLDDKTFPVTDYVLFKKMKYDDDLSYDNLTSSVDKASAASVFEFKVNSKNEVIKVGLLNPYHGYSDGKKLVQQTLSAGQSIPSTSIWSWNADNLKGERRRLFMQKSQRIVGIYDVDGETFFKNTDMNALGNTYSNDNMIITYYGEPMSSDFRLVLVEGSNMVEHGSAWGNVKFDFVTSVRSKLFDDGEVGKVITIGGVDYNIPAACLGEKFNHDNGSGATYNDIKPGAFVCYWGKSYFGDKNVVINSMYNLPTDISDWKDSIKISVGSGSDVFLKKGTVELIDEMRIYLEDGDVLFFNSDNVNFRTIDSLGNVKTGSKADSLAGREVYYVVDGNLGNTVPLVVYAE